MQVGALIGSGHIVKGQKFYVIALPGGDKRPACPRARKVVSAYCDEVANIGHDQSRVEIAGQNGDALNWRMSIDNPPAVAFFVPKSSYWVAFYPADEFTRDEALADAHA
jgi:hypothetical protein